jgi:hypothetical protein
MRKKKISKFFTAFLCFASVMASAQQVFRYKADLDKTDSAGFFRIILQPGLVAKCKADLSDIRIADEQNKFVPYVLADQLPAGTHDYFINFPIIKPGVQTDTSVVAENKEKITTSSLWLKLKNTAVSRTVNISGSDDLVQWFAISEDVPLQKAQNAETDSYLQSVNFPQGAYRYFKIAVNNKRRTPVAILQVGVFRKRALLPTYTAIPSPVITRLDSGSASFLDLHFADAYQVNQIHLEIKGPKYYKRQIEVDQPTGKSWSVITQTELISGGSADITLSAKTKRLRLKVINDDNPPLQIVKVIAFQSEEYLISYLEPSKAYHLVFGNSDAAAPEYDLKFFTADMDHRFGVLNHHQIESLQIKSPQKPKTALNNSLVWIAIITALIVLTILTFKMTAELNKNN